MIRQIEHHKNAFLTKRRRCIELVTALTPPRAMFAARAAAPRAPRATHASRASFARASLEKTPDFTAQKRKRVSFMPRLLDNNRAKHLTSDIQTWQRNVQRDISAVETVRFGDDCFVGEGTEIFAEPGRDVALGDGARVAARCFIHGPCAIAARASLNANAHIEGGAVGVTIGDDTRIGPRFSAFAFNHVFDDPETNIREQGVTSQGITIGKDVWIGASVCVTDGVHIGDHSVVGMGSVVTRDVEPYAVVAGNPARVIRYRKRPPPK